MPTPNNTKNRDREAPTFANINLLGKCNARCFFCLGEDIHDLLCRHDQTKVHFRDWKNFNQFLDRCQDSGIKKLYITGQNTDSLLYAHLDELISNLKSSGFGVGLRTNGYQATNCMETINKCTESVGYSIHSLDPMTNQMIMGRNTIPDWKSIISQTEKPRVQIVVNRCNKHEVWGLIRFAAAFPNVRYIQVRRVSTDTRVEQLAPDISAYEEFYTTASQAFPLKERLWGDAEVYEIFGKDVVFWRTVRTTVNSFNYFTDGTISEMYFVVEGYLNNYQKEA